IKPYNNKYFSFGIRTNLYSTFTTKTQNNNVEYFLYTPVILTLGSNAYRIFHLKNTKIKHTISPRINFSYNYPLNKVHSANLLSASPISYFNAPTRSLGFSVNNRFSYKKDKKVGNLGFLNFSFPYDFNLKKIPNMGVSSGISSLHLSLSANYNFINHKITSFYTAFSYKIKALSFSTRLTYTIQFTQSLTMVYNTKKLDIEGYLTYNYYGSDLLNRFSRRELRVKIPLHCFLLSVIYQNQVSSTGIIGINKLLFSIEIGKIKGSDMKIENDFQNDVISILGNREAMPN
ncbi:hypothetical protein J7L48_11830, partial [bacterium]|nr:hypothetical protein [bacterium]